MKKRVSVSMIGALAGALAISSAALTLSPSLAAQAPASLAAQAPASAQAPATKPAPPKAPASKPWVVPRTPDGKPDLQGNWTNETQTPLERIGNQGPTLTKEQAAAIEERARLVSEYRDQAIDPNRPPPAKGGEDRGAPAGDPSFIERISASAGGKVGGYNGFWLAPGEKVITIDGVARSSIIVDPPDGHIPALTPEARKRAAERAAANKKFGDFDHPELRPLGERCLLSFGSNAGPPMLPNYFYNNNYTIVQTKDHVMILTEMVHDVRIVRLNVTEHLPKDIRPWLGDSIGHWEGDTLVIETTNFHPSQLLSGGLYAYRGASENLKVTERITRNGADTLLYKFTVEDPSTFVAPFSGELPFNKLDELVYEYACHEGNYALSNMLGGERAKEREQKKQ